MKKLLGITCLLWLAAAQAQGSEMPVTPAKPLTLQEAWTLAEQNSISLKSARAAVAAAEGHAEDTRGLLWNNPEFNAEGLRRRGFSKERIALIKQMHRLLYRDGLKLEDARSAIAALGGTVPGGDADVALLLDFLAASTRGIVR